MSADEQDILDHLKADDREKLYRCRWSPPDAERVVPQLIQLLESHDVQIVDEALRSLFCIGAPAVAAAMPVARLTQSPLPITKHLAVLTLGQIADTAPELSVGPLTSVLNDPMCCRDAMRALAFMGPKAEASLEHIVPFFNDPIAKVRKSAIVAAALIHADHPEVVEGLRRATGDRSKIVREAAHKYLKNRE